MLLRTAALSFIFVAGVAHAGGWGDGSFENADALAFGAECTSAKSVKPVTAALNVAIQSPLIEEGDGSAAVVAAEIVAAALGHPGLKFPTQLRDWMNRQPTAQLIALAPNARAALARVADPAISELAQFWAKGKPNKWQDSISELQARLNP